MRRPLIERISPQLAGIGEIIWMEAPAPLRLALPSKFESSGEKYIRGHMPQRRRYLNVRMPLMSITLWGFATVKKINIA